MSIEDKRAWIISLLIACPFKVAKDKCPAKELRKLSLKEKIIAVDGMNDGMVHNLIANHAECLKRRESYISRSAG